MDPWDHETTDPNSCPSVLANFVFCVCVCVCVCVWVREREREREREQDWREIGGEQGHEIHVIVLSNRKQNLPIYKDKFLREKPS